jgi:hypothetical protein
MERDVTPGGVAIVVGVGHDKALRFEANFGTRVMDAGGWHGKMRD